MLRLCCSQFLDAEKSEGLKTSLVSRGVEYGVTLSPGSSHHSDGVLQCFRDLIHGSHT